MNNTKGDTLSGVSCSVEDCYYNKSGSLCTAQNIRVGGCHPSRDCDDTECDTFKPS